MVMTTITTSATAIASATASSMPPTDFDGEGRAEVIRLAFLLGGVTFNDVRLSVSEWVTRKEAGKAALLGTLPPRAAPLCVRACVCD